MAQLAILGGDPVRSEPIHYGKQYIDEQDCEAVCKVLKSDLITTGPKSFELESQLCELTGAKHAVTIANGTAALHAACYAAGISQGDEVITTPLTFAASSNCILYCGGTPVFADIDPHTYNISPQSIADHITPRTKAVVAVDYAGVPVELDEIREICKQRDLLLIEDASHSIGSKYRDVPVGNIADMTTFSFHPVKTVTGGEGGAILTNNEEFYNKMIPFRAHCVTREPVQMAKEPDGPWYYEQIDLGYNYRLTDFQAALVSSQMKKLPMFSKRRKDIVKIYNETFGQMEELVLQQEHGYVQATRHLYVVQLKLEKLKAGRREIFEALAAENIVPNVHYIPIYYFPYYQKLGYNKGLCPNAEYLYERILTLPLYYSMTDFDVQSVIDGVKKVISHYKK